MIALEQIVRRVCSRSHTDMDDAIIGNTCGARAGKAGHDKGSTLVHTAIGDHAFLIGKCDRPVICFRRRNGIGRYCRLDPSIRISRSNVGHACPDHSGFSLRLCKRLPPGCTGGIFIKRIDVGRRNQSILRKMRGGTRLRSHFRPAALGHLAQKIRLCAIRSSRSSALPCSPQRFSAQYRRDLYFAGPNPVRCLVQKLDRAFTGRMRRLLDMGRRNAEMISD